MPWSTCGCATRPSRARNPRQRRLNPSLVSSRFRTRRLRCPVRCPCRARYRRARSFRHPRRRPRRRRRARNRSPTRPYRICPSEGPRRASAAACHRSRPPSPRRRRSNSVKRLAAALALVALISGCASPRPKPGPPVAAPEPPVVAVTPAPPSTPEPEARPPLPPVSVGPRPEPPPAPREEPQIAPSPPPPTAPPVPAAQRGRFVVLNFDNADVETVIQAASEIIGFNYVLAPDVRGKVTVQTSGRIAQEEVFGVLLAILEVQGFTAVKSGNLYKIVRIEGARERAVPTIVGPTADPNRTTDEIITQIVPIKYSSVADLSALLRPLISTRGTLIAHRETNVLIITDAASNVTRLLDIIRLVDVQVAQEELQIIPISYADAGELAAILTQLFASGRVRFAAPGTPPAPAPVAPPTPGVPQPAAPGQPGGGAERAPLILPERRSNSLIVHAKKHEVETIRRLVSQLDVNIYGDRRG